MSLDSDYWLRFRSSGGGGGGGLSGWGGGSAGSARASAFRGAVRQSPQVMVKVTGRSKTAKGVAAHLDYIGREGHVEMRDQDGEVVAREEIAEIAAEWGDPASGGPRTSVKAVALTFSMPEGTNAESVRGAVRDTLKREIGDNNDYIMALHTDTAHPHVHALIRGTGEDGRTYNPRPDDLHRLREGFRRELNSRGIEAEATPCAFRMERQQGVSMALTKMVERAKRGEIDRPRRAEKAERRGPDGVGAGQARPSNRSEKKRWQKALAFWERELHGFSDSRDPAKAVLARSMARHTEDARAGGFGEVEHLPKGESRARIPQERDRSRGRSEVQGITGLVQGAARIARAELGRSDDMGMAAIGAGDRERTQATAQEQEARYQTRAMRERDAQERGGHER